MYHMRHNENAMDIINDVILSVPLFEGIGKNEKRSISERLENGGYRYLEYRPGEIIEHESCAAIVVSGTADIEVSGMTGTILRTVEAGDVFGIGMMYAAQQAYSTRALARSTVSLVLISKQQLDGIIGASPRVAMNLITILSDKISFLNRRIMTFTATDAEIKVALFLYNLSFDHGSGENSVLHLTDTYTAIARKLGIGRASLYRILDKLAGDGIIMRSDRTITVLKLNELRNIIRK